MVVGSMENDESGGPISLTYEDNGFTHSFLSVAANTVFRRFLLADISPCDFITKLSSQNVCIYMYLKFTKSRDTAAEVSGIAYPYLKYCGGVRV